jgi:pimeloyl-ACP methyl ester carboxylesterase
MDPLQAVVMVIVIVLIAALATEAYAEHRDRRRYAPPGQMVDVGGHRLHVHVTGESRGGTPTVILDSGMVSFSSNWAWIQDEIAKVTRVVAYDRAGLGWSDLGHDPHDAGANAVQLTAALQALEVRGPFVLAGHSYGGLSLRAFAAHRRDEIVGMVLVDASHPDQWHRFGFSSKVLGWGNRVSSVVARFGIFRVFDKEYKLLATGLPELAYAELMAFSSTPRALSASGQAAMAWDDVTRPLVNDAGDLGDMPLIVLSVTEQPRKGKELTELQAELATLSTNSRHVTVQGAYHEALLANEGYARVVTESILDVLHAASSGLPLAPQTGG